MPITGPEYAQMFLSHRKPLIALLEMVPAEHGEFKAWEGGMSLRALGDHLNASSSRVLATLRGEEMQKLEPSPDLAAALERLRVSTEGMAASVRSLDDEGLARVVPAFGGMQLPVRNVLDFVMAHEAHHKGQVWMMARMIGLEPPRFMAL